MRKRTRSRTRQKNEPAECSGTGQGVHVLCVMRHENAGILRHMEKLEEYWEWALGPKFGGMPEVLQQIPVICSVA